MDRQTTEYRRWQLSVFRVRPWVGCATLNRLPFDAHVVKAFSDTAVLAALKREVDEIEDAGDRPDAADSRADGR